MKKDWLVYRITVGESTWYVSVTYNRYKKLCEEDSINRKRIIIKDNLTKFKSLNFSIILNKLKK